jgi:signal transduction histidine kinase
MLKGAEGIGDEAKAHDVALVAGIEAVPTILDIACRLTGMGFAAVARVTETQWIACAVRDQIGFGLLPGGELPLKTTLCDEIRDRRQPILFDDARADPLYRDHYTPATYGLRAYISFPIFRGDGSFFGTLCAIDPQPAAVSRVEIAESFRLFADLIGRHIDAADRLAESEAKRIDAEYAATLRDQFMAVLGHDLRNPVAAILGGTRLLEKADLDPRGRMILREMAASAGRMERLIGDVMDFARGQLGGGIPVSLSRSGNLRAAIEQVVSETEAAYPGRRIATDIRVGECVTCDPDRIGQLLANLLVNALTHGAPEREVRVDADDRGGRLTLSVTNHGDPIDPDALAQLFKPFTRRDPGAGPAGLGLGLYIAAQIAESHRGTLTVDSTAERTRFTLEMPLGAAG